MKRPQQLTSELLLVTALVCGGCASGNVAIVDERDVLMESARAEQKTADVYRGAGAPEAAKQAQARADQHAASAKAKKYDGFWDWLADTLFYSWLYSGK